MRPVASRIFGAVGRLQLAGAGNFGHAAVFEQNVFGRVDAGAGIDAGGRRESRERSCAASFAVVCSQRAFHHRHADGDAVGDLFEDRGLRAVGHAGGDSRPRMMGPGMHARPR